MQDGARTTAPVTMTVTKKTMSRSFLIDSLIGGVKRPVATANNTLNAVPYHPQLNEYIQFLNRTAAAYGYQSQVPVAFPPTAAAAAAANSRFFGYPTGGGFGKDYQPKQQPAVVKPVPMVAAGPGQKSKHPHHVKTPARKRTADQMTDNYDPGKSRIFSNMNHLEDPERTRFYFGRFYFSF